MKKYIITFLIFASLLFVKKLFASNHVAEDERSLSTLNVRDVDELFEEGAIRADGRFFLLDVENIQEPSSMNFEQVVQWWGKKKGDVIISCGEGFYAQSTCSAGTFTFKELILKSTTATKDSFDDVDEVQLMLRSQGFEETEDLFKERCAFHVYNSTRTFRIDELLEKLRMFLKDTKSYTIVFDHTGFGWKIGRTRQLRTGEHFVPRDLTEYRLDKYQTDANELMLKLLYDGNYAVMGCSKNNVYSSDVSHDVFTTNTISADRFLRNPNPEVTNFLANLTRNTSKEEETAVEIGLMFIPRKVLLEEDRDRIEQEKIIIAVRGLAEIDFQKERENFRSFYREFVRTNGYFRCLGTYREPDLELAEQDSLERAHYARDQFMQRADLGVETFMDTPMFRFQRRAN